MTFLSLNAWGMITILTLTTKSQLDEFLKARCHEAKIRAPKSSYSANLDYFYSLFIQENKGDFNAEGKHVKQVRIFELCIYYALAMHQLQKSEDPYRLGEAAEISSGLINSASEKMEEVFGVEPSEKHAHILGNFLNIYRTAFIATQDKG